MINFFTRNKKYFCLIIVFAIGFNFVFLPLVAFADPTPAQIQAAEKNKNADPSTAGRPVSWLAGQAILFISDFISVTLGSLFGIILYIEAQIIDYVLSPNNFSFTNAKVVVDGWKITRDLANMFFILILLIIAFATVLRISSYSVNQLLWKIIVVALLINFSLVIAGFLIDFTQVLTTFFIKQGIGDNVGTITMRLADNMKITNFYNPQASDAGVTQFSATAFAAAMGPILTLIGLVITAFVFGATAIFLVVRIITIWFLLIIAPIAWISLILPETSGNFSKWWREFISWSFFAPVYAFMIYLSMTIFDKGGQIAQGTFGGNYPNGWKTTMPGLTTVTMPSAIFQWILVIAMMFGSLIIAKKFGVMGAQTAQTTLRGWGTSTRNWAGRYARRQATGWTKPLTKEEKEAPAPTTLKGRISNAWRKTGATLGRGAVAVPGARGAYLKMTAEAQKDYENSYNKYKNVNPEILSQMEQAMPLTIEAVDRVAIQQLLMEQKRLKPDAKKLKTILTQAKRHNKEKDILKTLPDVMDEKDWNSTAGYDAVMIEELTKQAIGHGLENDFAKLFPKVVAQLLNKPIEQIISKVDDLSKIYGDQLTADVVRAMSLDKFRDFTRKASKAKKDKVKDVVNREFSELAGLGRAVQSRVDNISGITDKKRRDQELKRFITDQQTSLRDAGVAPDVAEKRAQDLANLIRRRFIVFSSAWET